MRREGGVPAAGLDPEGEHAHSCHRNSGTWGRRHDHLRDQICRQLRRLGFWEEAENKRIRVCRIVQWWRGAVRAGGSRARGSLVSPALAAHRVGFLSFTLQRQDFPVLAGCALRR